MADRFHKVKLLLKESFYKLQEKNVLLLGVGGVGGFCLDALYRSGVNSITVVDCDSFEITNQNRQIGSEAVGEVKVFRMQTLYPGTKALHEKVTPQWVEKFDFSSYDLVIDAIDDMDAKVALACKVHQKLISSMGGAKKLDPTQIAIASVWKTHGDGLAKKFRYELKRAGCKADFEVVFSPEEPKCKELGSFAGVTGSFGLALSSLALKKLLNE